MRVSLASSPRDRQPLAEGMGGVGVMSLGFLPEEERPEWGLEDRCGTHDLQAGHIGV